MKCFELGMILVVLGAVSQVGSSFPDTGNCECQHKCVIDKFENSTYIARVTVKHEITSEYEGARAYRVSVTKVFPNSVENVERTTLLNDVHCPAKLDLHTKFLLAGSEVKYTPCSEPIMWINSCDVVVQWKRVTKKQHRLLRDGIAFDFCANNPCDAGEVCSRSDTEKCYTCKRSAGSEEDDCEQDSDDCQVKPCQNGGICTDGDITYTCSCATGFDGENCENNIDDCQVKPCQNGGICTDGDNTYTCSCAAGFDGENCENNINDCLVKPCQNGGICTDGVNTYTCSCATGFDGENCENNIDDCQVKPCQNGGICTDGDNTYTCSCAAGFDGHNCENIDCHFDHTLCGWTQDLINDTFDWKSEYQVTDLSLPGPWRDHTTGDGSYMVARGTGTANWISPTVVLPDNKYHCLKFWFHINRQGTEGELRVKIKEGTSVITKKVLQESSSAHNIWLLSEGNISSAGPLTIIFEAVVPSDPLSDIAIDDVSISPGSCPQR